MTAAFKLKALIPTEGDECQSLLQWAAVTKHQGRRLSDLLIMIPNGAILAGDAKHRAMQMARMKRQGFKPGVFDYFLAIPTKHHHGLWLELKRTKLGVVSEPQRDFEAQMHAMHYAVSIAKGWEAASKAIKAYLA